MRKRFDSLDALRGIACFLVIWQHVSESLLQVASSGEWAHQVASHFDFGRIGVVAFFCISGFVIPSSFRGKRLAGAQCFLINRFFRLYPIFWLSLAIGYVVVWGFAGRSLGPESLLANLTMLPTVLGEPFVMGLYWTLEIELAFYLLCTALFLCFGRLSFSICAATSITCLILFKANVFLHTPGNLPQLPHYLSLMFAASCLRRVFDVTTPPRANYEKAKRIASIAIVGFLGVIVLDPAVSTLSKGIALQNEEWIRYGYGHSFGVLLFLIACAVPKLPEPLAHLGRATYSAYLFHAIVFNLLLLLWTRTPLPHIPLELYIAISALATFAIALASYRWIELPSIQFGKSFANPPAPPPSPATQS